MTDASRYHACNLQKSSPAEIIAKNRALNTSMTQGLSFVLDVFDCAEEFLLDCTRGENLCFPIPIREIAQKCDFQIFEDQLANPDSMEVDQNGGRTTISQMLLRERRFGPEQGSLTGVITIDKNLSEYAKRLAIAHELGHYVLRTKSPVGLMLMEEPNPGPFAYIPSGDFIANEFAYALLMPYTLTSKLKQEYEAQNKYNPLNYLDWITVLKDAAQIPEYAAIPAYEEVKKIHLLRGNLKER